MLRTVVYKILTGLLVVFVGLIHAQAQELVEAKGPELHVGHFLPFNPIFYSQPMTDVAQKKYEAQGWKVKLKKKDKKIKQAALHRVQDGMHQQVDVMYDSDYGYAGEVQVAYAKLETLREKNTEYAEVSTLQPIASLAGGWNMAQKTFSYCSPLKCTTVDQDICQKAVKQQSLATAKKNVEMQHKVAVRKLAKKMKKRSGLQNAIPENDLSARIDLLDACQNFAAAFPNASPTRATASESSSANALPGAIPDSTRGKVKSK